jgi:L,D-transpeptidase-like protein
LDCDEAGMTWNDNANVCGTDSLAAAGIAPGGSTLLINIDKATQRMTVSLDGVEQYNWPVSTGQPGYSTPSGAYTASSMNVIWYSRQWDNAPMPHAVFFTREGHAIHGTNEVNRLGNPASHGCVRLSPQNAEMLFELVEETGLENTQIVLAGLTPGGEGRWASSAQSKPRYRGESYEPRKRGRLFRRWFSRR